MRRDLSKFLVGGEILFVCDSINDFQDNKDKILPFGSKVVLDGQYFVSYDFVASIKEIRWEDSQLKDYWVFNCVNGLIKHFRGSKLDVDVNPLIHSFFDVYSTGVLDAHIFNPVFSYKKGERLRLESYECVPKKPKKDYKIHNLLGLVPALGYGR